jgi:hypothetical protein
MSDPTKKAEANPNVTKHAGGCHCGAVRFEVMVDTTAATMCNCSICAKLGQIGGSVKPDAFKLLAGEDNLGLYEWGAKIGHRRFCKTCGIHVFAPGHLAELGGDFVSINFLCLDDFDPLDAKLGYWDGRHNNWQAGLRDKRWPIKSAEEKTQSS